MTETMQLRQVHDWEQLPEGLVHRDVADVAVDADDRVYVLARMDPRVIVYESDGTFVGSWGEGAFTPRPHGIDVGHDGTVYVVDEFDQTIKRFTRDGTPLGEIGSSGIASDSGIDWNATYANFREQGNSIVRGADPFNHPTKAAAAPNGDVYVSDGYGNARIHQFSTQGERIRSWGEPGSAPGEFRAPHCVAVHEDHVWVCDRENERIQIFELDGRFVDQWLCVQRPSSIAFDSNRNVYITEQGWKVGDYSWRNGEYTEAQPASVCVLSPNGEVVERIGGREDDRAKFEAPHGVAIDSSNDVYVGELVGSWFAFPKYGPRVEPPSDCPTLQKFTRLPVD